ncbi:hypothetical protein OUZ56_004018 [Daphnia magna]|uniref:Uncharacterized protein n=1 Tax=Daphnia magna TaxID=35525 RepID=A0ABQ9YNM7_9CRUS|nr:hypothetical protein OUZ56_004018 [Daphnia magna]
MSFKLGRVKCDRKRESWGGGIKCILEQLLQRQRKTSVGGALHHQTTNRAHFLPLKILFAKTTVLLKDRTEICSQPEMTQKEPTAYYVIDH